MGPISRVLTLDFKKQHRATGGEAGPLGNALEEFSNSRGPLGMHISDAIAQLPGAEEELPKIDSLTINKSQQVKLKQAETGKTDEA